MANSENTFIMIKPDGVQRALIGDILCRFEKKGFFLKALKMVQLERKFAEKFYAEHSSKPFFKTLVEYIVSGPVIAMVWEGKEVVASVRRLIGVTDPFDSDFGTIRGDFSLDVNRNVIHASDNRDSAHREIGLVFPEGTIDWKSAVHPWIYEN